MRIIRSLVITVLCGISAFAQNSGALVPVPRQQPLSNSGLILSGSCMYTYQAGSTTPAYTYSNPDLAVGHRNENPLVLDSSGRMPAVYLDAISYKFVFAQRFLGACPGSPGTVIWSQDSVYDFGQMLKASLTATTGAALIGYEPTGGTVPMTVTSALNSYVIDAGYSTFAQACAAAGSTKTLLVTALWAVPAGTYACDVWYLAGGKIRVAAGATAAMTGNVTCPTYQQCFDTTTNAGAAITFTKPPANINPSQFGADSTGVADSLAAFNATYATSNVVNLYGGTYRVSGQFVINRLTSSLLCTQDSKITYTGSGNIDSIIYAAIPAATIGTVTIDGCRVFGNSHVTGGLIHIHAGAGNSVRNVILGANSTSPPASCLYMDNGNTNQAIKVVCAGVYNIAPATGSNPALVGILLEDEVEAYVTQFKLEGIPNEGIKLLHSTGSSCSKSTIVSGTTEGNGTGISVSSGCAGNLFNGVDIEANSVADVVDAGSSNIYLNVLANFHFTSTSHAATLINSTTNNITIDAGAQKTFILNSDYGNTGGALTDNGTCTNILNLLNVNGGNYLPNVLGCQSGLTVNGSLNRVIETASAGTCPGNGLACPASVNNAIAGTFNSSSAAGGFDHPISCPVALNQTNDGMEFNVQLTHSVAAGSTFNFCGLGASPIVASSLNAYQARPSGAVLHLHWSWNVGRFYDMGQ